ncbi:hypothetical protein EVAR_97089_1 [Eumeta japonica]|uniref:Uncharacterized protein n=1 Tax=Eumeta variegata TaxID=151549 RepID=A0A4C1X4M9_EUMVA|nr:hypothetical protein EVAR_97089_1 [Eumeta japonica]
MWSADFLRCGGDQMMDSVFFQTSLLSRALQGDGWLATVSDAPLPLHFIGGASVAHERGGEEGRVGERWICALHHSQAIQSGGEFIAL